MIGVGFLRCFFIVGVMSWYTTSVWKTIDQYFRDQFKDYLQKEFESNREMKRDLMLQAERMAAQKALLNKIGKMGFSKGFENGEIISDNVWGKEHFGQTATEVNSRSLQNEYEYSNGLGEMSMTLRSEDHGDPGERRTPGEGVVNDKFKNAEQRTDHDSEPEAKYGLASKEEQVDENFRRRYQTPEDECRLDECGGDEGKEGQKNWRNNFLEEDDVCRLEDVGKADSCGEP